MNTITKKEAIIIVNFMFYLLTITFVSATVLFFVMLCLGYSLLRSSIISLTIGISLPTTLFILLITAYPLVASKVRALFHKHSYSLPLIGLEKSSFAIINLQNKFFNFVKDVSIVVVIFYILSILPLSNSIEFIHILFKIMLMFSIFLGIGFMAIDGIYIYFRCLFEIIFQFFKDKGLDVLLKNKFNNMLIFFKKIYAELNYRPKRLKKWPLVSGFIETLTHSIAKKGEHCMKKTI